MYFSISSKSRYWPRPYLPPYPQLLYQRYADIDVTFNFYTSVFGLQRRLLTWSPWIDFGGAANLNGEKIISLFSLTYNRNLAFHSVLNVGNKVNYGLQNPKFY